MHGRGSNRLERTSTAGEKSMDQHTARASRKVSGLTAGRDGGKTSTTMNLESRFNVVYSLIGMDEHYSIGELAREAGIPVSTVRYYERIGLVRPDGRTVSNYRVYGVEAVERVRFIRAAQRTGFTLEDITRLLEFRDGATAPCREVEVLIENRLSETKKRMEDLRRTQSVLKSCLKQCREAVTKDRCEVIEELQVASSSRSAKSPPRSRRKK